MKTYAEFKDLIGKTLISVVNDQNEELIFTCSDGEVYKLYHDQDCCESVNIDDIAGDLEDLLNSPILAASEDSSSEKPTDVKRGYEPDSETWTFYNISTVKGHVTIRWYGESNGYYSESVNFKQIM